MTHRKLLLLPLLLVLASCAALGVPATDTFNKKLGAAYYATASVYRADVDLEKAGTITRAEAMSVITQTDNVVAGLDLARTIHVTNASAGDDKLAAVLIALQTVQAFIAEKQK